MSATARRYIVAIIILLAAAAAVEAVRIVSSAPPAFAPDFATLPMKIGDYQGQNREVDEFIRKYLGAEQMLERLYTGPDGLVSVTLIYGAQWRDVHSPVSCFPAQGWLIVTDDPIQVPVSANSPTPGAIHARLLRVVKNDQYRLAAFAFCHPGGTTSNWIYQGWKVLTGPRGAGGVIVILNTEPIPDLKAARQRLNQFLAVVYPHAVSFWYQEPQTGS